MLNLLRDELHDNFPRLYRNAVDQWRNCVAGLVLAVPTAIMGIAAAETGARPVAYELGGIALLGAGLAGYGLGQLQETSRRFDEVMIAAGLAEPPIAH